MTLPKLSVLALFSRTFGTRQDSRARLVCLFTAGIVTASYMANLIVAFLMCCPLNSLWNPVVPGHIISIIIWWHWSSLVNIITDVMVLTLPIQTVVRMQAQRKVKIGLIITFITASM